jgi:hypothetical protein
VRSDFSPLSSLDLLTWYDVVISDADKGEMSIRAKKLLVGKTGLNHYFYA